MALAWLEDGSRRAPELARSLVERLLPEAVAAGDVRRSAWLRFHLGWSFIDADDFRNALPAIETAKAAFEALDEGEGLSRCLNALGVLHEYLGVYDLAIDEYRASAEAAGAAGRKESAGAALMNLAECLLELEEPLEALRTLDRCSRDCAIAAGNIPHFHHTAGRVYRALGRAGEAEREYIEAIETAGDVPHIALDSKEALAEFYAECGRIDEVERLVAAGLEDAQGSGERLHGARFRLVRAHLLLARNLPREAIPNVEAAIAVARELGVPRLEADAEKVAFTAWQACGEHAAALGALVRHHQLRDALKSRQAACRVEALRDERTRREIRHFEQLYRQVSSIGVVGRRITASLDLDASLESVYGAINGIMDAPSLAIAVVDEDKAVLDFRLIMVHGERKAPLQDPLGADSFGGWCVRNRREILIGDVEAEYGQYATALPETAYGSDEKSLVFVPLFLGDKVIGLLTIQSPRRRAYDRNSVEILRAVGAYLAIAIENSRLYRRVADSEQSLRIKHAAMLNAQAQLKHLHGIIPICAACKKIRDDEGSWHQLESYIRDHSEAKFSHGICPECQEAIYGDTLRLRR
ncbi:MAG TPA: GAF domain-containing protein [Holophaga sp.]|nr:GAF domain-containing protein [Holophaga sp.]HPS68945.1 GAF domain-containing protein [Holophaga sp.]